jgi:dTDP-4-amino-4,6-dideoxygalactose transaminase
MNISGRTPSNPSSPHQIVIWLTLFAGGNGISLSSTANMTQSGVDKKTDARPEEPVKLVFPFLDLKAQFASIREEVMEAVTHVMDSQHFILGPEVKQFEDEIAAKLEAKHAIGCASGTDALALALMAAGIGPGDEVVTTPFTFVASAGSIVHVGAKPVFVDIDPVSFNIDPAKLDAVVTAKTKAILPVHLFGLPADMDPILAIAKERKLLVVEDAAQAIGSRYKEKFVGGLGDFGCFSFFPSKNLGAAGDGGLITTNGDDFDERLRMIRVHGSKQKYFHEVQGIASRLDALQAAILHVKLRHLDEWSAGRAERAQRYRRLFDEQGLSRFISYPPVPSPSFHHIYNQFTIRAQRRDALKRFLGKEGIPSEIYYPLCLHLQKAFAYLGHRSGDFPVSERASQEVLSLPIFPELTDAQQDRVVDAVSKFYRQ